MSANQIDPVTHMSDLKELKNELLLAMEKQKADILRSMYAAMLAQTAAHTIIAITLLKAFMD